MRKRPSLRTVLLAATSLALAGGGVAAAAPPHAAVEIAAPASHAADEAGATEGTMLKTAGLAAAAAAAVAAFIRLVGFQRLAAFFAAAAPVATQAAQSLAKAPLAAVRAVGRAAASPFRFALIAGGLALFALTGLSVLDLEWAGGLAVGLALAIVAGLGTRGLKRAFAPAPIRKRDRRSQNTMNRN